MELAKSQKIVKVMGILDIIFAVVFIVLGISVLIVGGAGADTVVNGELADNVDAQTAVVAILFGGVATLVGGVIALIEGILALRVAKDATKVKPLWIFAILGIISSVVSLIGSFVGDSSNIASQIFSVALNCALFYVINDIKKKVA